MKINLSAIEKRANAATPGPWEAQYDIRPDVTTETTIFTRSGKGGYFNEGELVMAMHKGVSNPAKLDEFIISPELYAVKLHICELAKYYAMRGQGQGNNADAEFISNARQDIPALIKEVLRLRKELSEIKRSNKKKARK